MSAIVGREVDRRRGVIGRARIVAAGALPRIARGAPAPLREFNITAAPGRVPIIGGSYPPTNVWCYDNHIPGPEIRARQGEPVRITVHNRLSEDTTVHWHGVRLPNAMDGVPGLTQPPISPGESFVYEFTPPAAGTFCSHPHAA